MARPLSGPSGLPHPGRLDELSNLSTALAGDVLLARVQHAVGEAVLSGRASGRQSHPAERAGGDRGVLMVAEQSLYVLVVLDLSLGALVQRHAQLGRVPGALGGF